MRNLYEIVEGIMRDDSSVISQTEHEAATVSIVQCFQKVFKDMYIAKDSHYEPNSDYVAGRIPVNNYDRDRYKAESEIKKDIRKFFNLIKSTFPKVKCELKTTLDKYRNIISMRHYRLFITLNPGTDKTEIYGITITVDEKPKYNANYINKDESELNYIRVVVSDADLKRIFHQLVK